MPATCSTICRRVLQAVTAHPPWHWAAVACPSALPPLRWSARAPSPCPLTPLALSLAMLGVGASVKTMATVEPPATALTLLRTFSLPASTVSSFASISYTSCSRSPSESVVVGASVPPPPPPSVCVRGRTATGHLLPSRGHLRVRLNALMLPRPSIAADEASADRNRKLRRVLCSDSRPGTSGSNSTKARGFSAELMTQMSSALRTYLFWRNAGIWKSI